MQMAICIIVLCSTFFAACNRNHVDTAPVPDTQTASPSSSTMANQLQFAVNAEDFDAIERLITEGANSNTVLQDGSSLLQSVIGKGNILLIHFLIRNGADVNYVNPRSDSVFSYATNFLPDEELPFFIYNGLNLLDKTTGYHGEECSYFEYLIYNNKLQTAQVFLTHEEVLQEVLNDMRMDVKLIANWKSGSETILDFLIQNGFKLNTDVPLLQYAIRNNEVAAVKWLLSQGVLASQYFSPEIYPHAESNNLEAAQIQYQRYKRYQQRMYEIDGSKPDEEAIKGEHDMLEIIKLLQQRIAEETRIPVTP